MVPAAGQGTRFDANPLNGPKQYAPLAGSTVIEWSLRALLGEARVAGIVVVVAADDSRFAAIATSLKAAKLRITLGGASRQASVRCGLEALEGRAAPTDWVLVHDAARPCLTAADLGALLEAGEAPTVRGLVLAAPVHDTVKRERAGVAAETVDRTGLWRALTPQMFEFAALKAALDDASSAGTAVTDEAQAMERQGVAAHLVAGSPFNIKVTTAADLVMARSILEGTERHHMRIGQGFDVHAFGPGDHVVLGGVKIPHPQGVVAHSDGDVVIHALCDAILGALGLGDIGQHFPDNDPRHRGADSRVFLRQVTSLMHAAGLELTNADVTVLAEAPRIAKHRGTMALHLAADLGVAQGAINVKATTTERLGFVGRGEGLAASAIVLLDRKTS